VGDQDLVLTQQFQKISGSLGGTPITDAVMRGSEMTFTAGGAKYTGRVAGNAIEGTVIGGRAPTWSATRR
jgi:hypothetical protein